MHQSQQQASTKHYTAVKWSTAADIYSQVQFNISIVPAVTVWNADDADINKFSEVAVHLTKERHRVLFIFAQYYAKWYTDARLAAAITAAHSDAHVLSTYQPSHAHCPVPLTRSTVSGARTETTVLCPGLDSALYIHIPSIFQVELEKYGWQ